MKTKKCIVKIIENPSPVRYWYGSFGNKEFQVKLKKQNGLYEVIAPYPKSFVPNEEWWLLKNCSTLFIKEENIKSVRFV